MQSKWIVPQAYKINNEKEDNPSNVLRSNGLRQLKDYDYKNCSDNSS